MFLNLCLTQVFCWFLRRRGYWTALVNHSLIVSHGQNGYWAIVSWNLTIFMNAFHMPGSFRTRNPFESQYLVKSPRSPLLLTPVRLSQHVHPQWVGSSAGRPEDSWSVSPPGLLPSHGISVLPHIVSDTAQDMVGGMKFPFPWIYIYTTAWGAAADVSGGWQGGG